MSALEQYITTKFWYILMQEEVPDALENYHNSLNALMEFSGLERTDALIDFCEVVFSHE